MVELRQLRYFVAVAEELHFGRAAQRLRMTQPPLSRQIRSLERTLGVDLFVRGSSVALTAAGQALLPRARRALDAAETAIEAARHAEGAAEPRLRVGYPAGWPPASVRQALRRLADRRPEIPVELVIGHGAAHADALRAGDLDAAFLLGDGGFGPGLAHETMAVEPLVLASPAAAPPSGDGAEGLALLALAESLVLPASEPDPWLRDALLRTVAMSGGRPSELVEVPSMEAALSAVAAGLGCALVTQSTAASVEARGVTFTSIAHASRCDVASQVVWRASASTPPEPLVDLLEACRQEARHPGAGRRPLAVADAPRSRARPAPRGHEDPADVLDGRAPRVLTTAAAANG